MRVTRLLFFPTYLVKSKLVMTTLVVLSTVAIALWVDDTNPRTHRDFASVLFKNAEPIAITSAAAIFLMEFRDRQKLKHYEAWRVINSAKDQGSNGGRIQALQDLNEDKVSLKGVPVPDAELTGIHLRFAKLQRANFAGANLSEAKLYGASLEGANFTQTKLEKAVLQEAKLDEACLFRACLDEANLSGASLLMANLQKAQLRGAVFRNSVLEKAVLSNASLWKADLEGANLEDADLRGASLTEANFRGATLIRTNFEGAKKWTDLQLNEAKIIRNCVLPEGSTLHPDRDGDSHKRIHKAASNDDVSN